jgi:hypothetical protein
MAKRRTAGARPQARSTTKACLWLVPFYFDRPKTDRSGTFQIIVEATSPDDAMEKCHTRLHHLRETTKLIDEPIMIFSDGLVRLTGSFEDGVMVNFEVPQPGGGRISNLMPDPDDTGAMVFALARKPDEPVEPFIAFGIDDDRESGPRLTS